MVHQIVRMESSNFFEELISINLALKYFRIYNFNIIIIFYYNKKRCLKKGYVCALYAKCFFVCCERGGSHGVCYVVLRRENEVRVHSAST
jgi:hypothetical protein